MKTSEALQGIQKAKEVGDIHPNGKWVWTETPSGHDWRVIKNSDKDKVSTSPFKLTKEGEKALSDMNKKNDKKEVPTMQTFIDLVHSSKNVETWMEKVREIKNVPKSVSSEFFKKYQDKKGGSMLQASTKFFNEHKDVGSFNGDADFKKRAQEKKRADFDKKNKK